MSGKNEETAVKTKPQQTRARRRRPGTVLFRPEAQPLDSSVSAVAVVRPPRWRQTLQALFLAASLAGVSAYADETNVIVNPAETNENTEAAPAAITNQVVSAPEDESETSTNEVAVTNEVASPVGGVALSEPPAAPQAVQTPAPQPAASSSQSAITPPQPAAAPPQSNARSEQTAASRPQSNEPTSRRNQEQDVRSPNSNRPASVDLAAFRIISERNIFDPNRSPRRPQNEQRARPRQIQSFALVGTMSYEKGTFAFFDGSESGFRKAAKPGDKVAGFQIVSVSPNSAQLKSGDKEFSLQVGSQLRREDQGEWTQSSRSESYASTSNTTSPASSPVSPSSATQSSSAPTGVDNDVLRRLMQRREQE